MNVIIRLVNLSDYVYACMHFCMYLSIYDSFFAISFFVIMDCCMDLLCVFAGILFAV